MEHIGSRIKAFREEMGLTQTDLFRSTGIKQTTLSSIEGGTEPKAGIVGAMLTAYPNLNPDWLLSGTGPMLRDGRALAPVEAPATQTPRETAQPTLSADPSEVAEIKQQRDDWRQEAQTWKELYLSSIGRGELLGKSQPDNSAAEPTRLLAGFGEGRGARTPNATTMMVEDREYTFAEVAELELVAAPALVIGLPSEEEAA